MDEDKIISWCYRTQGRLESMLETSAAELVPRKRLALLRVVEDLQRAILEVERQWDPADVHGGGRLLRVLPDQRPERTRSKRTLPT